MPYAIGPWAATPYATGTPPAATAPGQTLPPPIPGGTRAYYWGNPSGFAPWAAQGYAGARVARPNYPGGVVAAPDPAAGVVRLTVWWPLANAVAIVRARADGTREPVRGGYTARLGYTRTNACLNPSVEAGLNGYVTDAGTPTLTRVTDDTAPAGAWFGRATNASAGSSGITVPTNLTGAQPVTLGFGLRLGAAPSGFRVVIGWADATGGALATTTVNLTANQLVKSLQQWARHVVTITPPAGAVTPTVKLIADGLPAGSMTDWDAITIEGGARGSDGTFFDGNVLGGTWLAVPDLSASYGAPVATVIDGECPLDEQVTYTVSDLSITGGQVTSDPVALESQGQAWLTHPSAPGAPFLVDLRTTPELTRAASRGVFRPLGRVNAITRTGPRRLSPTGTLAFNAITRNEKAVLLAALDDGSPVLMRAPAEYDWSPRWVSIGDITESREDRKAWQDAWLVTGEFVEVDAPSALTA